MDVAQLHIDLPRDLNYYFMLLMVFLAAYWIAYVFKNLSNLFESQGLFKFAFLMAMFFAVFAVIGPNVEAMQDYWVTGAYLSGFLLRFFRHDY